MVIPKGAQTDEAWEFINFTQQPAAQLILAKQGQLPTRQSVLSDPFFKTPAAQSQLQIIDWLKMNPHKAPLDIPQYPELLTALGNAFQDILAKKANVAQALQSAAQAYQSAGS
jgi:ABC-type glycerol-3-phosphate transport system substrate-binding protein